ncbi:MAG: YfhO family protein, partial [Nitrososphaeria archaeon]
VFNNNLSSRAVVFVNFSFAILSGIGLEILMRVIKELLKNNKVAYIIYIIGICLVAFQYIDLSQNIKQNSVVPLDTFYPRTNTINFIKDNIEPGQQVIATFPGYLISGTLTAYGIPEPFAHGYFKKEEKEILSKLINNPWRTPTSCVFSLSDVNITEEENLLFTKLFVRYILATPQELKLVSVTPNDVPAPSMPPNILNQTFKIDNESVIIGLSFLMATYGKKSVNTTVSFVLYDSNDSSIYTTYLNDIKDNKWVYVFFNSPLELHPGTYKISLKAYGKDPVTVWTHQSSDKYPEGSLTVNNKETKGDMVFQVLGYKKYISDNWYIFNVTDKIIIFENRNSHPIYVIDSEGRMLFPTYKIEVYKSGYIRYQVEINTSGVLVVPIRYWPGWEVYINGEKNDYIKYLIFMAIPISSGNYVIELKYNPMHFFLGSFIFLVTIVVLLCAMWRCKSWKFIKIN